MASGDSAGIMVKIQADSKQATAEVERFKKELKELEKAEKDQLTPLQNMAANAGLSAEQYGKLKTNVLASAAVIGSVTGVAIAAGAALFKMAQSAAEFGSQINTANQKTGLSAKTLSALKYAADQTDSSFEQVTKGVVLFGAAIGEAAQGNDKAAAKMKLLGVTSSDTREALAQAIKTIFDAKTQTEQLALASEAFGKRIGPDLIPLIKDANGNLDELEKKAESLGLTITDDAMRAADRFGDQLDTLKDQLTGVGRTIGNEVIPVFTEMAEGISDWLKQNQGEIKSWGQTISFGLREAMANWDRYAAILERVADLGQVIASGGALVANDEYNRRDAARQKRIDRANAFDRGEDVDFPGGLHPDIGDPYLPGGKRNRDLKLDTSGTGKKSATEKLPKFDFTGETRQFQQALRNLSPELRAQIYDAAEKYGIPSALAFAQLFSESSFKTNAKSNQGAFGIGQLQTPTASKALGRKVSKADLFDVDTNLSAWGAEMSRLFKKYGDWALAALAYHGGDGTADAYLKAESKGETALAGFAKGNPKSARYAQKIPALSGLSKNELIGAASLKEQKDNVVDIYEFATKYQERLMRENLARYAAESKTRIATVQAALEEGSITKTDATEQIQQIRLDQLKEELRYVSDVNGYVADGNKAYQLQEEINAQLLDDYREQLRLQKGLRDGLNDFIEQQQKSFDLAAQNNSESVSGNLPGQLKYNPDTGLFEMVEHTNELTDAQERQQEATDALAESWSNLRDSMEDAGNTQMAVLDIAQMGVDLMDNMRDSLQNAIERWLLYGESVGKALKMALAQELAHIAARAAIKAIEATAEGFLLLAFGQYDRAAEAFAAAAGYAVLAGATGLAAKALAPKQQAKPAGGAAGAGAAARQGTGSSGESGQIYSQKYGDDATILNVNRNQPETVKHEVTINIPEGFVVKHVANNINKNGSLRLVFRDLAAQG